jgi:uncharacterized OsmC-like protein
MFNLVLTSGSRIDVTGKHHSIAYATDGSLPNPLEATYAAMAGCAGVYAKKACRELGIDDTGIAISLKVVGRPEKPLLPARLVTAVEFPGRINHEQRAAILASINKCAVKALIEHGAEIDFSVG